MKVPFFAPLLNEENFTEEMLSFVKPHQLTLHGDGHQKVYPRNFAMVFSILPRRWITPAVLRIFAESYALVPGPGNSGDLDVWSSKSPLKLPPHGDSRLVKSQLISSAVFTALFAYMIVAPHCRGKALVQNPLISTTCLRPFKCLRPLSIL